MNQKSLQFILREIYICFILPILFFNPASSCRDTSIKTTLSCSVSGEQEHILPNVIFCQIWEKRVENVLSAGTNEIILMHISTF